MSNYMASRPRRENRGAKLLQIIDELDEKEDAELHRLSDDEISLTSDESSGQSDAVQSSVVTSDADSDFSDEEEEGRLDSKSSSDVEREARRTDADQPARRGVKRSRQGGPVIVRHRKESAITQEERMGAAMKLAVENETILVQQQKDFATHPAAGLVTHKQRRAARARDQATTKGTRFTSTKQFLVDYGTLTVVSFANERICCIPGKS
jgi:hypothetical protein